MNPPPPVTHLVVLAHPDPNSFCADVARCWLERAESHNQIAHLLDLYRSHFDPVLKLEEQPGKTGFAPSAEILDYARQLKDVNVLVLVYPIWFGTPPAMMKGYIERVVGIGTSFADGGCEGEPLRNIRLVDISTSATSEPWLAEHGVKSSLFTIFDRYIANVFGALSSQRLHLDMITTGMDRKRGEFKLAQVREFTDRICADANKGRWLAR